MYSLVSSAVLVTDLLKQSEAAVLLTVMDTALQLTGGDLVELGRLGADRDAAVVTALRLRAAALDAHRPGVAGALHALRRAGSHGEDAAAAAAAVVAGTSYLGLADLHRLLAGDVLAWAADQGDPARAGVQAVCDAVTAAWAAPDLLEADADLLAAPWRAFTGAGSTPAGSDLGPQSGQLRTLLAALAGTDAERLDALDAVVTGTPGRQWAEDMHAACWAAHLSGRLRLVAAAQVAAGRALLAGGCAGRVLALRAGRAVPGAVQALSVADLLDDETVTRLTAPVLAVYGPLG